MKKLLSILLCILALFGCQEKEVKKYTAKEFYEILMDASEKAMKKTGFELLYEEDEKYEEKGREYDEEFYKEIEKEGLKDGTMVELKGNISHPENGKYQDGSTLYMSCAPSMPGCVLFIDLKEPAASYDDFPADQTEMVVRFNLQKHNEDPGKAGLWFVNGEIISINE